MTDLDEARVRAYIAQRAPQLAELEWVVAASRLGLVVKAGTNLHPTVCGLLCFGFSPQLLYPQWGVAATRVDGTSLADPLALTAALEGPLPELLEQGLAFVREHSGPAPEYPEEAVREALVNALVHRDLRHPGRVAVQLFTDRLVIRSPGGLPNGVPALDGLSLEGGESLPRNPLLTATARSLGMCEQIGRGLTRIRRVMSEATEEPTSIVVSTSEVRLTLPSLKPATH